MKFGLKKILRVIGINIYMTSEEFQKILDKDSSWYCLFWTKDNDIPNCWISGDFKLYISNKQWFATLPGTIPKLGSTTPKIAFKVLTEAIFKK